MNWSRYWFPKLGGRRQCLGCGFFCQPNVRSLTGGVPSSILDVKYEGNELGLKIRERVNKHDLDISVTCALNVWNVVKTGDRGKIVPELKPRSCELFFPYQPGFSPDSHVNLKQQAASRAMQKSMYSQRCSIRASNITQQPRKTLNTLYLSVIRGSMSRSIRQPWQPGCRSPEHS